VARGVALAAALALALLAVSGAGGAGAQTPKRGGTVAILPQILAEPACLNLVVSPCLADSPGAPVLSVLYGAFAVGPDLSLRPKLVSDVDFTTKPPFTLTYHIRPKAHWSDGVPITVRDFVFTHKAIRMYSPPGLDAGHRSRVRSVRALDAKTARVVLRSRFGGWRGFFPFVLPEHALRGENLAEVWIDRIDNPKTAKPIGSGPFLVGHWDRGEQLTLVRNPNYWGRHRAYLDRIIIRFRENAAALTGAEFAELFRAGEVDIVQRAQFSEDLASALQRLPDSRLLVEPGTIWEHFDIRGWGEGGHPLLKRKRVRQALAYGIDRVALVQELFGEVTPQARPLDSDVFLGTSRWYKPNWSIYRHRPELARRLLEREGCRRGADDTYSCAGVRLSLRFISRGAPERRVRTLELVQARLRQVGIEVLPSYAPPTAHDQILERGDFDVTLFMWIQSDESGQIDTFGCQGRQNYAGYCQRLVTRDLDQSERILDERKRARVLNRADAQLARDVPVIPLFQVPLVAGVRSNIRNYVPHSTDPTWNAENWWLAQPR
jgi:peptide/nickel transport system substrate-binding protein